MPIDLIEKNVLHHPIEEKGVKEIASTLLSADLPDAAIEFFTVNSQAGKPTPQAFEKEVFVKLGMTLIESGRMKEAPHIFRLGDFLYPNSSPYAWEADRLPK